MKTLKELVKIAGVPVPEGYRYVVQDSDKTVWATIAYPQWIPFAKSWYAGDVVYLFKAVELCKDHERVVLDIKEN